MSERPPTYAPLPQSAPSVSSAFSTQPSGFPSSPYQTFPQTYRGGDHSYYQGPQGQMWPLAAYQSHARYQGYQSSPRTSQSGTPQPWDGPKTYGEMPKYTVFVVEQNHGGSGSGGGTEQSWLAACSAALCCCCLWDVLTNNLC